MENIYTESLLHPKIANFYNVKITDLGSSAKMNYINTNDLTYNWGIVDRLLFADGKISTNDPVFPKTYDEYAPYVQLLHPLFLQSEECIKTNVHKNTLLTKLQWLGHQTRLPTVLQEHLHPSCQTSTVENILLLTSLLENALANVYQSLVQKSPPHLLRDLLDTNELRAAFGICPIFFLKIIMGSPESINLRNIVWHGFPLPHEVPSCYVSVLIITAASLSTQVEQIKLKPRPQVTDFRKFVTKIRPSQIDFTLLDKSQQIMQLIEQSRWTGKWEIYWKRILHHYEQGQFWQFMILILPQIELVLRKMFGEANKFDIRAKLHEYYITMDNIFESKDNALLDGCISRGTLHFLYDVFISPYGMRIRDKISHGEVDLDCVDKDPCSLLLYGGLNLLSSDQNVFPLDSYESKFHLNYLAHEAVAESKKSVLGIMKLRTPSCLDIEFNWNQQEAASLTTQVVSKSLEIFNRHKKESEIVMLIMKTAQLLVQVCQNYQMSFEERFRMLLNHELRSRARKTLEKMVETMSIVATTLISIVKCLINVEDLMQTKEFEWFEETFTDLQRFCKQTLKTVENFVRFSDKESNEWLNALECCRRFQEIRSRFKELS